MKKEVKRVFLLFLLIFLVWSFYRFLFALPEWFFLD